jgi:aspartyl-tRNA(Asn)/glutamyl-tRNA(Gln) amidotransferase subunit A
VERVFNKAIADLEGSGIRIQETELPDLPYESATIVLLVAEVATAFEDLERSGRARLLADRDAPLAFVAARAVRGADYVKAARIRTLCQKALAEFFARWDVVVYPAETRTAFGASEDFSEAEWADPAGGAGNLCGLPAISVPCGFADDGMPAGMGLMSGAFEGHKAIGLARHYQRITTWHEKRPLLRRPAA